MAVLISDTFTRTSTTTPGTTDTGQAWSVVTGTWGTIGNEAYSVSDVSGDIMVLPTAGTGNYDITVSMKGDVVSATNFRLPNLIFRYIDSSNFLRVRLDVTGVVLGKYDAGVSTDFTPIYSTTLVSNTYYLIRVKAQGSNITVWVDGTQRIAYTLTGGDATKYASAGITGFRLSKGGSPSVAARWDTISVSDLVQTGAASIQGVSTLSATGTVIAAAITGSASLQGVATINATATVLNAPMLGSSSLQGVSSVTATASLTKSSGASLQGVSTVTTAATVIQNMNGSASLVGTSRLTVSGDTTRRTTEYEMRLAMMRMGRIPSVAELIAMQYRQRRE